MLSLQFQKTAYDVQTRISVETVKWMPQSSLLIISRTQWNATNAMIQKVRRVITADEVDQEAITVLLIDIVANRVMLLRNKIDGSKLTFRQQSLEIHDAHMRRLDDLILANDEMIIEHESNKLIWRTKTVLTDLNRSISNHGIVRTRIRSAFEKISTLSLEIASLKRELASNCPERLNTDMLDLDVVIEATQSKIAEYTIPYDYPIFGDKSSLQELESALVNLKNLEEVETDVLSWTINVDLVNVTEELKLIIRIHELASGNIWWKRKPYVLILEDLEVELPRFSANFHDIVFEIEHEDTVDTSEGIIYYKV